MTFDYLLGAPIKARNILLCNAENIFASWSK